MGKDVETRSLHFFSKLKWFNKSQDIYSASQSVSGWLSWAGGCCISVALFTGQELWLSCLPWHNKSNGLRWKWNTIRLPRLYKVFWSTSFRSVYRFICWASQQTDPWEKFLISDNAFITPLVPLICRLTTRPTNTTMPLQSYRVRLKDISFVFHTFTSASVALLQWMSYYYIGTFNCVIIIIVIIPRR